MHVVAMMALLAAQAPAEPIEATEATAPAEEAPPAEAAPAEEAPAEEAPAEEVPQPEKKEPALTSAAPERTKLLVLDLGALSTEPENARVITGVVASIAGECPGADVMTGADLRTMLELSAAQQASGCDESSCLVELADSLGAKYVVYGDVGKLGAAYVVTVNLFDADEGSSRGRKSIEVATLEEMPSRLRPVMNELLTPLGGVPVDGHGDLSLKGDDGLSPLVIVGGGTAGAGALAVLGFGAATLAADAIASEPTNAVEDKEAAIGWGRITLVGTIAGIAVAGVGAGILVAGVME
jgi:TolB-like protein